jgi:hypothetical protein
MNRITLLMAGPILFGVVLGISLAQQPDNQVTGTYNRSPALGTQDSDDGSVFDDSSDVGAAAVIHHTPEPATIQRYLVTYVKSRTDPPQSATVLTVINQSSEACEVRVGWFSGFEPEASVCTTTAVISPGVAHDFCSRELLEHITTCNSICDPELSFVEGKAHILSSAGKACSRLGIDARVYYTTGEATDMGVAAVSNPTIVSGSEGNRGD